jgi:beta-lactamase class A
LNGHDKIISIVESYKNRHLIKEVGAHSINLLTGKTVLDYNSGKIFHPASTIKLAVACEVLRQVEAGQISASKIIKSHGRLVGGSGLLRLMLRDVKLSVSSLLSLMLDVSDNSASNWLLDIVGRSNVNSLMSSYGLDSIHLQGHFMSRRKKRLNTCSPKDMSKLMELVYRGEMVSPYVCSQLKKVLLFQQHSMIASGLPGWWVKRVSKGGALTDLRADVSLIWGRGYAYTLAVWAVGFEDAYYGESFIREVSHEEFSMLGKWSSSKKEIKQTNTLRL